MDWRCQGPRRSERFSWIAPACETTPSRAFSPGDLSREGRSRWRLPLGVAARRLRVPACGAASFRVRAALARRHGPCGDTRLSCQDVRHCAFGCGDEPLRPAFLRRLLPTRPPGPPGSLLSSTLRAAGRLSRCCRVAMARARGAPRIDQASHGAQSRSHRGCESHGGNRGSHGASTVCAPFERRPKHRL